MTTQGGNSNLIELQLCARSELESNTSQRNTYTLYTSSLENSELGHLITVLARHRIFVG